MSKHSIFCLFFLLCISFLPAIITDYAFNSTTGTYNEISGGSVYGDMNNDNQVFNAIPLGFNINYNGVDYDQISIAVNGYIGMGTSIMNSNTAISTGVSNNVVAACNRDICSKSNGELMSLVSGTAPYRVFIIQWKNYRRTPTQCASDILNFQIQLHETTNIITYSYGAFTAADYSVAQTVQVGLRGSTASEYVNRTTSTNWSLTTAGSANNATCKMNALVVPSPELEFSWTPPAVTFAPNAAINPTPLNEATLVSLDTQLSWSTGGGIIGGYRVYFGTDNPPSNLENGSIQTATIFNPGNLEYGVDYYWQIVPFNIISDAADCPIWHFSTATPPLVIMGNVRMLYNQSNATNVPVNLYNSVGSLLQTCITTETGEYRFEELSNSTYYLIINSQSILVDEDYMTISAVRDTINLIDNVTHNIDLSYKIPILNTSSMSYIGMYKGCEYWRSNWGNYWIYMRDDFYNRGGHLVSIADTGESQFITQYVQQNPTNYLLGLEYQGENWQWIDGTPLTYTNWSPGQPSGDLYCSYINSNGTWNSVYYWNIREVGIMESNGMTIPYSPKSITNLSMLQQRDYTVSLNWTNPSEVLCGLNLNPGFDTIIKRNGIIVATLHSGIPGQTVNWQDHVSIGGQSYEIYINNGYGESEHVSQSILFGNAQLSGSLSMAYNQIIVAGIDVKLYDDSGTTLIQTCTADQSGHYFFDNLYYLDYKLKINNQTIFMDGDNITIASIDTLVSVRSDMTFDIKIKVYTPPLNTADCTFIGYYGGHGYWRTNWNSYWHYMRDDMNNRGGHLVTINSAEENQFITQYITQYQNNYWLGLFYDGTRQWVDGSPVTYTNWAPGEPDNNEYATFMRTDGTWDDVNVWGLYTNGIMESNTYVRPYVLKPISNFSVQVQRDFHLTLSWNNPTETIAGLNANPGFDIVIKRGNEVVATFNNGIPGQTMNWQDFVLTGHQTYKIYTVDSYGESEVASQSVQFGNQVQGIAKLNNTQDHSGIKVLFTADPTTPAATTDSTYTNSNGFYSINLNIGRYTVTYTKYGYMDAPTSTYQHSQSTVLPEQSLEYVGEMRYLSGSLSGTLSASYAYIINSQIWVDGENTLTLEPGVRFYFKNGVSFNVYGTLTAIGTALNPIVFTSLTGERRGDFWINNSNSQLERCEFTKADWGLRINSNVHVSYCKFYNVTNAVGFWESANENCLFDYNEIYSTTGTAITLSCYGARVENNEIYNNQLTGYLMFRDYGRTAQFKNNYIHHNTDSNILFYVHNYGNIVFSNNRIENNTTQNWLFISEWYPSITFTNNVIHDNICSDLIRIRCSGLFDQNLIYNNSGSVGFEYNNMTISRNTIVNNTGNGLMIWGEDTIQNNIVAFNGGKELCYYSSYNHIGYNLFYDTTGTLFENSNLPLLLDLQAVNSNGTASDTYFNISVDPSFFNMQALNYNLSVSSPCINAGDPGTSNDPDGTVADMGALYYDMIANSHAQIGLPSTMHNFLATPVGQTCLWNCPVRNTGTDPLIISGIQLNNPVFYLQNQTRTNYSTEITVLPNETGYIPIVFAPTAIIDYSDTLRIFSNALMNPTVCIDIFGSGAVNPNIVMSMPQNNVANILSNFGLPLNVTDTTPYNILSYNLSITYDPAIFEYVGFETENTLSDEWIVAANNEVGGILHLGASGTQALQGAGILIKPIFHTKGGIADGTQTFINLNQIVMNEGGIMVLGCYTMVTLRDVIYGDVDDNLQIQAYDAALTLQYSVMMDPIPLIDPRPWVDWRKLRADVSGDGNIYAYDASLILQRVVGLISSFPVELTRPDSPHCTISTAFENDHIILSTDDFSHLYSLNLRIHNPNNLQIGAPILGQPFSEVLFNQFSDETSYYFAMAATSPANGSGVICSIPVQVAEATQMSLNIVSNEECDSLIVNCTPTSTIIPSSVSCNYLLPNSPNPFNPSTTINFGLKTKNMVCIEVYNLKGQLVKGLLNSEMSAGDHHIVWNGVDNNEKAVSSGIYFCRTKIGNNWIKTQKMMLLK